MSDKKQSSIDWLVEEINKQKAWADPLKLEPIIQRGKAMHKEEIENAYDSVIVDENGDLLGAKEYYNETFGDGNND